MSLAHRPHADQAARLRVLAAEVGTTEAPRSAGVFVGGGGGGGGTGGGAVVAICSGKGGVGKTTFTVNAAAILAKAGVRTIVVDLDIGVANADVLLGVSPQTRLTRSSLAAGRLDELVTPTHLGFGLVAGVSGLRTAARLRPSELDGALLGLDRLRAHADLVLVDTGAGVGVESITLAATADASVVVTTPEPASIADAYAAHKCIALCGIEAGGQPTPRSVLVVNMAKNRREADDAARRIDATSRRFLGGAMPCVGWVRRDDRMHRSVRARVPVAVDAPMCKVSKDLRRCARAIWSACSVRCADVAH